MTSKRKPRYDVPDPVQLPESVKNEIEVGISKLLTDTKLLAYVDCQHNSDDHLMLVVLPRTQTVVRDITFRDGVLEHITPFINDEAYLFVESDAAKWLIAQFRPG